MTVDATASLPPWLTAQLAACEGDVRSGRTLAQLVADRLPADRLDRLRGLAFVMLRPDALSEGTAAGVLTHLREREAIEPSRLLVRRLSRGDVARLYAFTPEFMNPLNWLHDELFAAAPAALALVAGEPGGHDGLSERLDALKGPSSPLDPPDPVSLRDRHGRTSSFHAVLHVASDTAAMLRQSTLFFGWAEVARLLGDPPPEPLAAADADVLLSVWLPHGASVFQAHLHVKRRIAAALHATADERDRDEAGELRALTDAAARDLAGLLYREQLERFAGFARRERPLLREWIARSERLMPQAVADALDGAGRLAPEERLAALERVHDRLGLLHASWYLSGHQAYARDDGASMFALLERAGVPLCQRTRALLRVGLHTDVNPDHRWNGRPLFPDVDGAS